MAYPTDYPRIPVGARPPYGAQVPMRVPVLGGGMVMDKRRLMAIMQRYFDGQITKADYMRAMQAYFAQVSTGEPPSGATMPERPEFEKPEITAPLPTPDTMTPISKWEKGQALHAQIAAKYPVTLSPPTQETKQRQIYSYRDRVQPPKAAQPSIPQTPVTGAQPEGRPARYQYPQYRRKAYGWQRKGNLSWW